MSGNKTVPVFLFLCIFFAGIFLFSAKTGTINLNWKDFWEALFNPNSENLASILLWQIRIPRFVASVLCGGSLALCGQMLQVLVRNPLAEPYTLGTGSGAALGLNLALAGWLPAWLTGIYLLPFWAFAGAFTAGFVVMLLAGRSSSSERLLLGGIAVSIFSGSLISFLLFFLADAARLRQMVFWAFGSLDKVSWQLLLPVTGMMVPVLALAFAGSRSWNLMLLGEEKAASLGVSALKIRRSMLLITSFLTAASVCLAGPIGFAGLVVPYCVRQFIPLGKVAQPMVTFISGALFLAFCDLLARVISPDGGIPAGLITSLVGLPVFLYLLRNSRRKALS